MRTTCIVHPKTKLVHFCPACRGAVSSKRKTVSSRKNGRLGGRPKKEVAA